MSTLISLAAGRQAHRSGALWLEDSRTALLADVHLGYGWAQRRRGQLGPVLDTKSDPKLQGLVDELKPARIVFIGDVVHAPRPIAAEREAIEATLGRLRQSAELIIIRGNHDRAFARDFGHLGLQIMEQWQEGGLAAVHGDRLFRSAIPEGHLIFGHLHPALTLRDAAGAAQRLPLFLVSAGFTVLPAFSPFAAGSDISRGMPAEILKLANGAAIEGVAATGKRVMRIGCITAVTTAAQAAGRKCRSTV